MKYFWYYAKQSSIFFKIFLTFGAKYYFGWSHNQWFVKNLSGHPTKIQEFFDFFLIKRRVWINSKHVNKSFKQQIIVI